MSDDHIDEKLRLLEQGHGVALDLGAPRIAYRERIERPVELDQTHKKRFGEQSEFARINISFAPSDPGADNTFASAIASADFPKPISRRSKAG